MIKMLHLLCVFVWMGNLFALTRLMAYLVEEEAVTRVRMSKIFMRMYNLVGLPAMGFSIIFGAFLMGNIDQQKGLLWFFLKMGCVCGLVVCDVICGQYLARFDIRSDHGKGMPYKIIHAICGLLLIALLTAVYIVRIK